VIGTADAVVIGSGPDGLVAPDGLAASCLLADADMPASSTYRNPRPLRTRRHPRSGGGRIDHTPPNGRQNCM